MTSSGCAHAGQGRLLRLVTVALLTASPAAGQDLRMVPLDDPAYRFADALLLRNPELGKHTWFTFRPWRGAELDSLVSQARGVQPRGALESGWLEMLAGPRDRTEDADEGDDPENGDVEYANELQVRYRGDLREADATFEPAFREPVFDADRGEPEHRGLLRHDFAVQPGDRFALGWRYVIDSNIRNDPTRRTILGLRGTEAAFEVLDAYATARAGPLRATAGRQTLSLGPGRGASAFLSESMPGLDHVRLELHADPIRFTALVATLSRERPNRLLDSSGNTIEGSIVPDTAPVPFDVARFLYLHRVDWRVVEGLQVAISEAAVVTGVDRGLELRFANPFIPFFITQQEGDEADSENVNVVVDLSAVISRLGKSRLYGDLFVQEFFIDADKREEIGNQLAWRLGGEWADPLGWIGGSAGAEYTRADVFMYLHRGLNTNWTTFGVPLGSTLGPDADQLLAWTDWWLTPATVLTFDFLSRRNGERDVTTLESVIDAGNPSFPSGVVQREWRLGAELWAFLPEYGVEGRLRIGRREVENIAHERGRDGVFWEARIGLVFRLRLQ